MDSRNLVIKNKDELLSQGVIEGREAVLNVLEQTFSHINYYTIMKRIVALENDILTIDKLELNLNRFKNIYLIGGGKHATFMAAALEEILGDRVSGGVIIEKKGAKYRPGTIPIIEGGHPVPDQDSVKGAEEIIKIAKTASEKDLVMVCVSGGWTALAASPPEGITLEEFKEVYDLLLQSGMTVTQMNVIRYHLSRLGQGKLPAFTKNATIVGLIAVDEVSGLPWGPTVPDDTTFSDAITVLKHFDLLSKVPSSVRTYLEDAAPAEEMSKKHDNIMKGAEVHNIIIADNIRMCEIAQKEAVNAGINAFILSTTLEGEAKHVGTMMASIANEVSKYHRPFAPPCMLIASGETTVTLLRETGEGGRNQELVLSASLHAPCDSKIVLASIGTDGTDGPTNIAGAIMDGTTRQRAKNLGINLIEELKKHNSSFVFKKLGDAVYTLDTGTNLMDIIIIYIMES